MDDLSNELGTHQLCHPRPPPSSIYQKSKENPLGVNENEEPLLNSRRLGTDSAIFPPQAKDKDNENEEEKTNTMT